MKTRVKRTKQGKFEVQQFVASKWETIQGGSCESEEHAKQVRTNYKKVAKISHYFNMWASKSLKIVVNEKRRD